jgi:hypothetical protein
VQFLPATDVLRNFNVTLPSLLNQTISFSSISNKLTTTPPFTVTATASSGLPVALAIVSGPATISGNTITLTGTVGTVTVSANQAGNAQYNPAPQVLRTFTVSAPGGGGTSYCTAASTHPWNDWISKVQLNTINNASGKSTYSNFISISTTLSKGVNYPITLTTGYSYTSFNEYYRVWIDYDINGVFEDTEIAYQGILNAPPNGTLSGVLNGSFTVPTTAASGTTRMRVSMQRNAYSTACQTFQYGEVEDYTVSIASQAEDPTPSDERDADLVLYAGQEEERTILHWGDESDAAVSYYVLEKSMDGVTFEPMQNMEGALYYGSLYDNSPIEGANFYRLKAVLPDLNNRYSTTAKLDFEHQPNILVYPNPAGDAVFVRLAFFEGRDVTLSAYNSLGHLVYLEQIDCCTEANHRVDTSAWHDGVYTLVIDAENARRMAFKVVIMK